jgi:hypothetical protein
MLEITVGSLRFTARWETSVAPMTCATFRRLLPLRARLIQARGISETEVLFPYGSTSFASKAGPLAGNHFASIEGGHELLAELGRRVLYDGAQEIVFNEA